MSTQQEINLFERERYLFESLRSYAEKANAYTKGMEVKDWVFSDAANIVRILSLAMESITNHCKGKSEREMKGFKKYFISQLNMELFEELNNGDTPEEIFRKTDVTSTVADVWGAWSEVRVFFEFMFATDEDLAD